MHTNVEATKVEEYIDEGYESINYFSDDSYYFIEMEKTKGYTGHIILLQIKSESEYKKAMNLLD